MEDASVSDPPPAPLLPEVDAFNRITTLSKKKLMEASKFLKKLGEVPEEDLPLEGPMKVDLTLAERYLFGKFVGSWPYPKNTEYWLQKNWRPLISNSVTSYLLGRGFFLFNFISK